MRLWLAPNASAASVAAAITCACPNASRCYAWHFRLMGAALLAVEAQEACVYVAKAPDTAPFSFL